VTQSAADVSVAEKFSPLFPNAKPDTSLYVRSSLLPRAVPTQPRSTEQRLSSASRGHEVSLAFFLSFLTFSCVVLRLCLRPEFSACPYVLTEASLLCGSCRLQTVSTFRGLCLFLSSDPRSGCARPIQHVIPVRRSCTAVRFVIFYSFFCVARGELYICLGVFP